MAKFELTPAQRDAVETTGGTLLVSAAAGSGKTRVLVERMMREVCRQENPCNVDDFLIITYTRAAAAELRGKIAAQLQKELARQPDNRHLQRQMNRIYLAQISTVHAFCSDLLRRYAYVSQLPTDFRVAEESECSALRQTAMERTLERAYTEMNRQPEIQFFIDTLSAGRNDAKAAAILQQAYDSANCQRDPRQWMQRCVEQACPVDSEIAQTPWGGILLEKFHRTVADQMTIIKAALEQMQSCAELQAKYAPAFASDLQQLQLLAQADTWDGVYAHSTLYFEKLGRVSKCSDAALQEQLKVLRKEEKDALEKAVEVFTRPAKTVLQEQSGCARSIRGLFLLTQMFSDCYQQEKRQRHLLDFSDLEHETLKLLCRSDGTPTLVAREISAQYRQIMVDEYQDSNRLQDSIFFSISQNGRNVFLVGDVKQSIYRFRLADPTIFLEKYQAFPDVSQAAPGEPRKVLLSENFRSRAEILEATNSICRMSMSPQVGDVAYTEAEELRFGRKGAIPTQPAVELHCIDLAYEDPEHPDKRDAEAAFVAQRIDGLLQSGTLISDADALRPVQPGDIVVLLSSVRTVAPAYMRALARRGIRASCEQDGNMLETTEISSILSLLQVIDNPHQDIALYAAMASPLFGFTADEIARARACSRSGDLYDCLGVYAEQETKTAEMLQFLQQMRQASKQQPADQLLTQIYGYLDPEAVFGAMEQGQQRVQNLRSFLSLAVDAAQTGNGRLPRFLKQIESRRERGIAVQRAAQGSNDCVRIMSIHKSKGLEFPVVVLAGLSKRFNIQDMTRPVLLHAQLGAATNVVDLDQRIQYPSAAKKAMILQMRQEMVSEQMRVLYVALTRAKDMLIMTYAESGLPKQLQQIAQQLDLLSPTQLAAKASRLGHWVLTNAMQRIEAGALFELAGRPRHLRTDQSPWQIYAYDGSAILQAMETSARIEPENRQQATPGLTARHLSDWIHFSYPWQSLAQVPSKVTATQLKGRYLDQEVESGAKPEPFHLQFRQARFHAGPQPLRATQIGTATHLAMQFINYQKCTSLVQTQEEIDRLTRQNYLTPQQAQAVSAEKITRLFASELGRRILKAPKCVREFRFSVLVDAEPYFSSAPGEQLMLQGVTDCCLMEADAMVVIDFKTDHITPQQEARSAQYYKGQLDTYAKALEQIFKKPVKEKILYFFATEHAVVIPAEK